MAVLDGYDCLLVLASSIVNGTVTHSLEETVDTIDITTKDSSRVKEYIAGESGWTISVDGKVDLTDTYDVTSLRTALQAKAAVAAYFGNGVGTTNGQLLSGNVIITSLSLSAPKNGEMTWSCSLQGTGALTESTSASTWA